MGRLGKRSIVFENPPCITAHTSAVGKNEAEGPLGEKFDLKFENPYLGEKSWEHAESKLQYNALLYLLKKSGLSAEDIDFAFGGDLINQCVGTYFSARDHGFPLYGLYGACSTCGEALQLSAMAVAGGFAKNCIAVTSSHFCSSEKQFRYPLEYGGQRTPTAQWTVTGSGAFLVSGKGKCRITHITTGEIVDMGITDANNMGAAMAPAAADTLIRHFKDTKTVPGDFDLIVTGDLGLFGKMMLERLMKEQGYDLSGRLNDCGCMIYDTKKTDKHSGGSGCGCSAAVLSAHLLPMLEKGEIKNLLFVPTGAIMSPLSVMQGDAVSGVAHALRFEV